MGRGDVELVGGWVAIAGREEVLEVWHGQDACSIVSILFSIADKSNIHIPEIVPVSYPNRTPPNATKAPTQMAGHALPASSLGLAIDSFAMVGGCI